MHERVRDADAWIVVAGLHHRADVIARQAIAMARQAIRTALLIEHRERHVGIGRAHSDRSARLVIAGLERNVVIAAHA